MHRSLGIAFSSILVTLVACGGGQQARTASAPGSDRAPAQVPARAAYELGCAAEAVTIREIADKTYAASGCGAEAVYVCMGAMGQYACRRDGEIQGQPGTASAAALTPARDGAPVSNIVRPRAAHELSCAVEQVEIFEIAALTYVARGCDGDVLFACVGAMGNYQCELD